MAEGLILLGVLLGGAAIAFAWNRLRVRRLTEGRLEPPPVVVEEAKAQPFRARPFHRRHRWLPWLVAVLVAAGACFYFHHLVLGLAVGAVVGLLIGELEVLIAVQRTVRIEVQLGDAIDLMIGALQVGVGVINALETAVSEIRRPLRPQLEEVLGRIRYGDDPQVVLRDLVRRVPLESFRLFTSALSVHWRVGGNLFPILGTVARAIRDRIEVSRRIRSLTMDARVSILAILGSTYFIAFVTWYSEPETMTAFLATSVGKVLLAAALFLQGIGIVWSSAMSRLRY